MSDIYARPHENGSGTTTAAFPYTEMIPFIIYTAMKKIFGFFNSRFIARGLRLLKRLKRWQRCTKPEYLFQLYIPLT
jgi:hypothetical protein